MQVLQLTRTCQAESPIGKRSRRCYGFAAFSNSALQGFLSQAPARDTPRPLILLAAYFLYDPMALFNLLELALRPFNTLMVVITTNTGHQALGYPG
jgi:hypothetical protein